MPDIRNIIAGIVWGFRDSILGAVKVIKYRDTTTQEQSPISSDQSSYQPSSRRKFVNRDPHKEPSVLQRISQCCLWNGGVFLLSILIFRWIFNLVFGGEDSEVIVWYWTGVILSWIFGSLWILPLFILSKVINCFWFQDIADAAYMKNRGKPRLPNLSLLVADVFFSITLQIFFLIQGNLFTYLPIPLIGQVISAFHLCLLYALYAFEYKWFNMGMGVELRLAAMEKNWPYYTGFGLPLAVMTSLPSSHVIGGCVFSTLFPLFIISANEAREPSKSFDIPIKIFTPVVRLLNLLIHHSHRRILTAPKRTASTASPRKSPSPESR